MQAVCVCVCVCGGGGGYVFTLAASNSVVQIQPIPYTKLKIHPNLIYTSHSLENRKQDILYINFSVVSLHCMGQCKSWTLDSGLDHGLDYGLEYGLNSRLIFKILAMVASQGLD